MERSEQDLAELAAQAVYIETDAEALTGAERERAIAASPAGPKPTEAANGAART
jgi:hypothetical protein